MVLCKRFMWDLAVGNTNYSRRLKTKVKQIFQKKSQNRHPSCFCIWSLVLQKKLEGRINWINPSWNWCRRSNSNSKKNITAAGYFMSNSISLFLTRPRGQAMEMANDWFASGFFKTRNIIFHRERSEKPAKSLFYGDKKYYNLFLIIFQSLIVDCIDQH